MVVTVAVEGDTDVPVAQRILELAGLDMGAVYIRYGKDSLDLGLAGFNRAARFAPWLVLRDLDRDAACAPELVHHLLRRPARLMRLRVAVKAMEAWLLADKEELSRFIRVPKARLPIEPERVRDPKQTLINLARTSKLRAIREDMVPAPGTSARVGPGYSARIIEFASTSWRPAVAADRSVSLRRCIESLQRLTRE